MESTNSTTATSHRPSATQVNAPVVVTPSAKNAIRKRLRAPPRSATAPSAGPRATITRLAIELARPSRKVMSVLASPALQTSRKKIGKKPAIMTVAKAEFAQSYSAQETTARRSVSLSVIACHRAMAVIAVARIPVEMKAGAEAPAE